MKVEIKPTTHKNIRKRVHKNTTFIIECLTHKNVPSSGRSRYQDLKNPCVTVSLEQGFISHGNYWGGDEASSKNIDTNGQDGERESLDLGCLEHRFYKSPRVRNGFRDKSVALGFLYSPRFSDLVSESSDYLASLTATSHHPISFPSSPVALKGSCPPFQASGPEVPLRCPADRPCKTARRGSCRPTWPRPRRWQDWKTTRGCPGRVGSRNGRGWGRPVVAPLCSVPGCTGIQLRHENSGFYKEVSQHLAPFADAVKELEHIRRMTRELLEVETIETSKLRYKILHLPGIITREIEAAVTKARESNESELTQLQNELQDILLEMENTAKKQTDLEDLNSVLRSREKMLSDEYQQAVDLLNQQMSEKASKSIVLNETHNKRKDAQEAVTQYKIRTEDLAEDMVKERQQFTDEISYLNEEIAKTMRKTEVQVMNNTEQKQRLSQLKSASYSVEKKHKVEKEDIISLKGNILVLQASHARLANKLEVERILFAEICDKKETLDKQMVKQKGDFSGESGSLNAKISELDEEMDKAEMLHQTLTAKNSHLREEYQALKEGEEKECITKKNTARKLENARTSVNEKMEIYGRLNVELKEMELETAKLAEVYRINTEQLARHVDEFKETLEIEKQKRLANQSKKDLVLKELELWKLAGETFLNEMRQRIENGQKQQLSLSEESNLLKTEIEHLDKQISSLKEENTNTSEEYSNMEQSLTKEIQQLEEEVKIANGFLREKSGELASQIAILDKTSDTHKQEQQKYDDLKKHAGMLKSKKKSLEASIDTISKDIQTNTHIKETKKTSLQSLRKSAFEKLQNEFQNTTSIERDIYELNRKTEVVVMENCRLKLCNTQFKDDIDKSVKEGRMHTLDIERMGGELVSILKHIEKGREKDTFVCNDFWERDKETLDTIAELAEKLVLREVKIGHLNGILRKEFNTLASMLDDKTVNSLQD